MIVLPVLQGVRTIQLTKGKNTLVDESDYGWLSQWSWYAHSAGYAARTRKTGGKKYQIYMHREILGDPPGRLVDHRKGDGFDNTRGNLRETDRTGNNRNKRVVRGRSRFKGVNWESQTRKWRASITVLKVVLRLGRFSDEETAARVYDRAAREHFGEFAFTNFPD